MTDLLLFITSPAFIWAAITFIVVSFVVWAILKGKKLYEDPVTTYPHG